MPNDPDRPFCGTCKYAWFKLLQMWCKYHDKAIRNHRGVCDNHVDIDAKFMRGRKDVS